MNDNILVKMQNEMHSFSNRQKLIARYLIEHYDRAAFMTASRLAQAAGASESTVVRFATELGYNGFPDMQKALQDLVRTRLTSVQRIEIAGNRFSESNLFRNVLMSDIDKIRATMEQENIETFEKAVDTILGAKRIYILGVRSASALANFMSFYFNLLFDNIRHIHTNSVSETFEQLLRIGEGDVLIGISFPRYSRRTIQAMKFAYDKGASVIAITDSILSPMVRYSNIALLAKSDMASFVDSLVAPLSVINALICAIGMRKKEDISKTFQELEEIWEEYDVYEKYDEDK